MICRLIPALAALLLALTAGAQKQIAALSAGTQTYSNVVVLGFNTTDLYFTHAKGIANVKLKLLEPALQAQFGYDPAAAAQAERKQAEDESRYAAALSRAVEAEARRNSPAARASQAWAELGLSDPLDETFLLNHPAPEIAVEKWLGAKPDAKGRLTLVVFWATGSLASRTALPQVNAWNKAYAGKLLILGVTPDTEREVAQADEAKPEFPIGSDPRGKLAAAMAVRSLPCCVLIDPAGYVRFHGHPAALDDKKLQAIFALAAE